MAGARRVGDADDAASMTILPNGAGSSPFWTRLHRSIVNTGRVRISTVIPSLRGLAFHSPAVSPDIPMPMPIGR